MSAESSRDLSPQIMPECLVGVLGTLDPSDDAISVLSRVSQIESGQLQTNGNVRRLILCSRCSLISVIEHDIDFNLIEHSDIRIIKRECGDP